MFKKTLIAAAVATVASTAAMADVSISGKVESTLTSTDSANMVMTQDAKLVFKASEDLGNGMTASAEIVLDTDQITGGTSAAMTQNQTVAISGGFGTVVMGRMEDFTESKVLSMVDVFGGSSVELGGDNAGRQNGATAYVSPAINGLTVGVAGFSLNDGDDFDATDIALMYANGPLAINLAVENMDDYSTKALTTTTLGVKYTVGDLSVAAVMQDIDTVSGTDTDDAMVTAVYNMGNNSVAIGWNDDESEAENDTVVELRHNFSKRTRAYIGVKDSDTDTEDTTYLGMEHSF